MGSSHPADTACLALTELAATLGIYWSAFDAEGSCGEGLWPRPDHPCAEDPACALRQVQGTCPAAASTSLSAEGAGGGPVVACYGTPTAATGAEVVEVLAQALRSRRQAESEMESTVKELAVTYQELAIAYGVLEAISLPSSREMIAQSVLAHISNAFNAAGACFLHLEPDDRVQALAVLNLPDLDLAALQAGLLVELPTHPGLDTPFTLEVGAWHVLASAVRFGNAGRGLIAICRGREAPFNSREAKLLCASGRQAALAIRNRALVEELRALFVSTVQALVAAIEAKDPYTCGHSRRVAESARSTARALGLRESHLDDIHTAAVVHDVGKIAVDDTILRKDGKLTEAEWETVKSHPDRGAGIVNCIPQLRHIASAVRFHHERRDGRGYPFGLRDGQIPLEAGIIAVCDSFDAMTSERPYRAALSVQQAQQELVQCSGTQFDPTIVKAFMDASLEQDLKQI